MLRLVTFCKLLPRVLLVKAASHRSPAPLFDQLANDTSPEKLSFEVLAVYQIYLINTRTGDTCPIRLICKQCMESYYVSIYCLHMSLIFTFLFSSISVYIRDLSLSQQLSSTFAALSINMMRMLLCDSCNRSTQSVKAAQK